MMRQGDVAHYRLSLQAYFPLTVYRDLVIGLVLYDIPRCGTGRLGALSV